MGEAVLPAKSCPSCGQTGGMELWWSLVSGEQLGEWTVGGQRVGGRVGATVVARVGCRGIAGRIEGAELSEDGTTFTAGHFVPGPPQ